MPRPRKSIRYELFREWNKPLTQLYWTHICKVYQRTPLIHRAGSLSFDKESYTPYLTLTYPMTRLLIILLPWIKIWPFVRRYSSLKSLTQILCDYTQPGVSYQHATINIIQQLFTISRMSNNHNTQYHNI